MKTKKEVEILIKKVRKDYRIRLSCWLAVCLLFYLTATIAYVARYLGEPIDLVRVLCFTVFGWGWIFLLTEGMRRIQNNYVRKAEDVFRSVRSDYVAMISGKEAK
jgi:hypothetical protein